MAERAEDKGLEKSMKEMSRLSQPVLEGRGELWKRTGQGERGEGSGHYPAQHHAGLKCKREVEGKRRKRKVIGGFTLFTRQTLHEVIQNGEAAGEPWNSSSNTAANTHCCLLLLRGFAERGEEICWLFCGVARSLQIWLLHTEKLEV